ncbi:MAG: xanthine dehydrogenase family protein molybdopterin-binding subunit [Gemmatimonadota bacterium]
MPSVGSNVLRKDGLPKVAGTAKYVDDLTFPGMLYGRTIRSTIPRGKAEQITSQFDLTQFVIATHADIAGENIVHLITDDQPCLVEHEIRHVAEPIMLIAHEDPELLWSANVHVVEIPEEPVLDPLLSTVIQAELIIGGGDVVAGLASADLIVEGEYRTGHQEQLYIETNGVVAVPENGGITLHGSIQCPFYVHRALVRILRLDPDKVRVIQAETGGGFGGKEEYPSILAAHAALLALKAKRPVKMVYDRVEDMLATTKRHPFIVRHRTGVMRDGRMVAADIEIIADGGAYVTLTPVVLSRGAIHAAGPYNIPSVRIHGRAMMTNTPPNGAFRGFGAPQTQFAMEVHVDRIANALGMDAVELRRINALRPGAATATGQRLGPDCSAVDVLDEAVRRSDYYAKRASYTADSVNGGIRRGIGLSLYYHGSGFTGAGELKLASEAAIELTPNGVRVHVASAEIGQGTRTIHAQIVADALGISYDQVETALPDTSLVPDSGPTVASRTCMVVGGILQRCAGELKDRLDGASLGDYYRQHGAVIIKKQYERPKGLIWDEDTYRGDAYGTFAWACDVAEIEFDPDTYEVRPVRLTAVSEIGKAIHPVLVQGQIEGGTAQGVGYALIETVVMRDGAMANSQLTNYTIPTTLDTPAIDTFILERPYEHGPFGAKGVGELPIDGPAPALVNALRQIGLDICELPATPEVLMSHAPAHAHAPAP